MKINSQFKLIKMEKSQIKKEESFKMSGNWATQSKELKGKYEQLTDADLKFETGKEAEMLDRVASRLNKNRQEVINIIKKGQPQTV